MTSTRCLLARSTGELLAYPRQDDEPVAGLDRDAYQVLQVVRLEQPTPEPGYRVQALPPVVVIDDPDGDDLNGTVTYGWEVLPIDPPAPAADWATFKSGLLISADVADVMAAARVAGCEPAVTALPVALERAEQGQPADFAACWRMVAAAGGAAPHMLEFLAATAEACHLPAEFVACLDPAPAPGLVRARDGAGRFIADDPTTPENEAWVQPE